MRVVRVRCVGMHELIALGLSKFDAARVQKRWGVEGALLQIKDNPYLLLGLRVRLATVDGIAWKLDIPPDDPRRILAIAHDVVNFERTQGHCYMLTFTLANEVAQRAGLPREIVEQVLRQSPEFVFREKRVMPIDLWDDEDDIAKRVHALVTHGPWPMAFNTRLQGDIQLDEQQCLARDLVLSASIAVITGPPGSGKTTVLNEALRQYGLRVELCAPTGKAALRLSEVTRREARTIHRLLQWVHGEFTVNESYPIEAELVVVDESSMIQVDLAADLLRAVDPRTTRIIFVGDANQLPPVGPGAFFRDLISSGTVPVAELKTNHRAAELSWVYRNAPRILAGQPTGVLGSSGVEVEDCGDFEFHELEANEAWFIPNAVVGLVEVLRKEGSNFDEMQVLSPMRVRDGGCNQLNREMQSAFNPDEHKGSFKSGFGDDAYSVREGDRVVQTRNNYDLGVFNGECGEVEVVSRLGVRVRFGKQYRSYSLEQAQELQLAYAMTVHKAQGQEFKDVIFVCHSAHGFMLTRQLLYTAVTRARRRVFLVGDIDGIKTALRTIHDSKRRTLLTERLRAQVEACP